MGDVEDPELCAAHPLIEWEQTAAGRWIMEHAVTTPTFHITQDYNTFGFLCYVNATFNERDAVEYSLRFLK